MPGISHEGKKGRCRCCRRCDPPDGRKNGKGGGPLVAPEGDSGRRAWRDAAAHCHQSKMLFSQRGRKGRMGRWESGNIILLPLSPSISLPLPLRRSHRNPGRVRPSIRVPTEFC